MQWNALHNYVDVNQSVNQSTKCYNLDGDTLLASSECSLSYSIIILPFKLWWKLLNWILLLFLLVSLSLSLWWLPITQSLFYQAVTISSKFHQHDDDEDTRPGCEVAREICHKEINIKALRKWWSFVPCSKPVANVIGWAPKQHRFYTGSATGTVKTHDNSEPTLNKK